MLQRMKMIYSISCVSLDFVECTDLRACRYASMYMYLPCFSHQQYRKPKQGDKSPPQTHVDQWMWGYRYESFYSQSAIRISWSIITPMTTRWQVLSLASIKGVADVWFSSTTFAKPAKCLLMLWTPCVQCGARIRSVFNKAMNVKVARLKRDKRMSPRGH